MKEIATAVILGLLAWIGNVMTSGQLISIFGAATHSEGPLPFTSPYNGEIPGSKSAKLCALTSVAINSSSKCRVYKDAQTGIWKVNAEGGASGAICEATCIY